MKLLQVNLFIILTFFSSGWIFAQDEEKDLSQGIDVYLYNGYAAGYRFNECDNSFWRVNLDLYSYYNDGTNNYDGLHINMSNKDTSSYETQNNRSNFSISLSPQYLFKLYQNEFMAIYSGGGILIGYNRSEDNSKSTYLGNYTNDTYQYAVSTTYSAGLIGILGLEGKLIENFSVFVESQLSGTRSWSTTSSNATSITGESDQYRSFSSSKAKGWAANLVISRVGIIFKF